MGLATFDGPQLLILDEPTNHLDIDSRAELIEAINEYEGACILVSHDRRLLEACVDRLWLVANGTVKPFDGDVADYGRFVLGQGAPAPQKAKREPAAEARAGAEPRPRRRRRSKREIAALEEKMSRFQDLLRRIDEALAEASARGGDALKIADLAAQRGDLERALAAAEEAWLELSEAGRGAVSADPRPAPGAGQIPRHENHMYEVSGVMRSAHAFEGAAAPPFSSMMARPLGAACLPERNLRPIMRPRGKREAKIPCGSEFAGKSDLFAKKCAEKALHYKGLRKIPCVDEGNYFVPAGTRGLFLRGVLSRAVVEKRGPACVSFLGRRSLMAN